ncbi:MAG: hypothetical protein ACMUEM_05340 [Flavobacteriales bacterium AspAUS03]
MVIYKSSDGRVLFSVPWYKHVLVGTTDIPLDEYHLDPQPQNEEVAFILQSFRDYFKCTPQEVNILIVFSRLRPLGHPF